jgi:hypothetical protein
MDTLEEKTDVEIKEETPKVIPSSTSTPYTYRCFNCRDGRHPSSNDYCVCTSGG